MYNASDRYLDVVHTENTTPILVIPKPNSGNDANIHISGKQNGFLIIIDKIVGETGFVDTSVNYAVKIKYFWAGGKITNEEVVAGGFVLANDRLYIKNSDLTLDDNLPEYINIELTASAGTPSDVRVYITLIEG